MGNQDSDDSLEALRAEAVLREHTFASHVPLIGGFIAAFRRAWNNVATRWYVLPLMQQQSEFNRLVVERLANMSGRLDEQSQRLAALEEALTGWHADDARRQAELAHLEEWIAGQDRELTELRHDLGELALLFGRAARLTERGDIELGTDTTQSADPPA